MAESDPAASARASRTAEAHLVLAPAGADDARRYCEDHLARSHDRGAAPTLTVCTEGTRAGAAGRGESGLVLLVGERRGSAAADGGPPALGRRPPSPPESVEASGDLGAIGATTDEVLTAWTTAGHRPAVCVDSLGGLLGRGSMPSAYRFLYVLLRRVGSLEVPVHVHADPQSHEREILRTFYPLFDRIVTFQARGASVP